MAIQEHVDIVKGGASSIKQWREMYPHKTLDLEGADLSNVDLTSAELSGAMMRKSNLTGADLTSANLTDAELALADLSKAVLLRTVLYKARLGRAKLNEATLDRARLLDADLAASQLCQASLNHAELLRTNLSGANLDSAVAESARMNQANLKNADLSRSRFLKCVFWESNLSGAQLRNSDLRGSRFYCANLQNAVMTRADLSGAEFEEVDLSRADLFGVKCTPPPTGLETSNQNPHAQYFDQCVRGWRERWTDWESLRTFGRLPLFGVSYTALLLIVLGMYAVATYNKRVVGPVGYLADRIESIDKGKDGGSERHDRLARSVAATIRDRVHDFDVPSQSMLLLISMLVLALASTIYVFGCPPEIKDFTRVQWCYQLNKPLLHYWPLSWRRRKLRLICGFCYVVGGLGVLWVMAVKIWRAGVFIWENAGFSWL